MDTANSELTFDIAAIGDAAAVRLTAPIVVTDHKIIRMAIRTGAGTQNFAMYLGASSAVGATASLVANALARVSIGTIGADRGLLFDYWNSAGTRFQWDIATSAWTTPTVGLSIVTAEDYHEVVVEVDGEGQRFRLMEGGHYNSAGGYTENQGYKYRVLTDWVTFAAARSTGGNPLYLVFGYPATDAATAAARTSAAEWISVEDGAKEYFTYNMRDGASADYVIGLGHRLGNARRGVPTKRTEFLGVSGATTENTKVQMRTHLQLGDGTHVMYYYGVGSTGSGIHAATFATWEGTVTKQGMMVASVAGGDFVSVVSPYAVWDADAASTHRYKILCSCYGTDNKFRIYVAYSANPLGTFTLEGAALLGPGGVGDFDEHGCANPVCWWETDHWEIWYAGNVNGTSSGYSVGRATATALTTGSATKDGSGARIPRALDQIETLTATLSGRTALMASTTGFVPDQLVIVDSDATTNNWGISRARKITTNTSVELYHGLVGFASAAMFGFEAGSITPHDIRLRNGVWEFYCSVFSVTTQHGSFVAFMESSVVYTCATLTGTPVISWIDSPIIPLFGPLAKSSAENVAFAHSVQATAAPFVGANVPRPWFYG